MASRRPRPRRSRGNRRRSTANATAPPPHDGGPITVGEFLTDTWLPQKRRQVRATTAYRYAWFVDRYINPAIGDIPLRRLRVDHLERLYEQLATPAAARRPGSRRRRSTRCT